MSNKYFAGNKGHYIFCDICGQPVYSVDAVRLSAATGRPGLLVCPSDADGIDYGLIPRIVNTEKSVKWSRPGDTDVTNGASIINYDDSTELGV